MAVVYIKKNNRREIRVPDFNKPKSDKFLKKVPFAKSTEFNNRRVIR